jgi:hypothetical protein
MLIGGCSLVPIAGPEWPDEVPDREYFVQAYNEDTKNSLVQNRNEYFDWVRQFYLGSDVNPLGWLYLERGFLQQIQSPLRAEAADRLRRLGQEIAAEWAKDNRLRLITSTMLLIWSQVIQEAGESDSGLDALYTIEADVAALLDKRLPAEAVSVERYVPWTLDSG